MMQHVHLILPVMFQCVYSLVTQCLNFVRVSTAAGVGGCRDSSPGTNCHQREEEGTDDSVSLKP